MPIEHDYATMKLGYVESGDDQLVMTLVARGDGTAEIQIHMFNLRSRRSGETISLGYYGATELQQLLTHAQQTIQQMIARGQISGLAPDRGGY